MNKGDHNCFNHCFVRMHWTKSVHTALSDLYVVGPVRL